NDADYWQQLSRAQMNRGLHDEAVVSAELALRLNPSQPSWYLSDYGLVLYAAKKYEEAVNAFKTCITRYSSGGCKKKLPVALVRVGKLDEARQAMQDYLDADPKFSMQKVRPNHYGDPEMLERYVTDLRAAGAPEEAPATH
ncbi:MAG: tetratricopeptide repeat protein, partial [Geminicoccaceae bacterium]